MRVYLLIFYLILPFFSLNAEDSRSPSPPSMKSDFGYITLESELKTSPEAKRAIIYPQSELPVISLETDSVTLLVTDEKCSYLCELPRNRYNRGSLLFSEDWKKLYFREGTEGKIVPIVLEPDKEFPIIKSDGKTYIIQVPVDEYQAPVSVKTETPGLKYSEKSSFDIYSEEQAKKGLSYSNGKWIPSNEAEAKKEHKEKLTEDRAAKLKLLKDNLSHGWLAMKDGTIIKARYKGASLNKVLIQTQGAERWISLDDITGMSPEQMRAKGCLLSAGKLLNSAKSDYAQKDTGKTVEHLDKALAELGKVSPSVTEEYAKASELRKEVNSLNKKISDELKLAGNSLYKYEVFKTTVLNYHLKKGHILLKPQIWLSPEQLCSTCNHTGKINCPGCSGKGYILEKCKACVNGRVTCPICNGEGFRTCPACKGNGYFQMTCSACSGKGYYWTRRLRRYGRRPGMVVSGGHTIVVVPGNGGYGYWPDYSYEQVECSVCNGTGIRWRPCKKCAGNGTISCPKTQKCKICSGTGYIKKVCPECMGKKEITCPTCKGKGYTGKPQQAPEGL